MSLKNIQAFQENAPKAFEWSYLNSEFVFLGVLFFIVFILINVQLKEKKALALNIFCLLMFVAVGLMTENNDAKKAHSANLVDYVTSFLEETTAEEAEIIQFVEKNAPNEIVNPLEAQFSSERQIKNAKYGKLTYFNGVEEKKETGWFNLEISTDKATFSYKYLEADFEGVASKGMYNKTLAFPINGENASGEKIYIVE